MISYKDYAKIPEHMMAGLKRYVEHGIQPGSFLTAVLTNDLREAVANADDTNIWLIPVYVAYLYNNTPRECWGSEDRMNRWIKQCREQAAMR